MTFMASLCVKMLLDVVFLSGALADCRTDPNFFITAPTKMEALSGSCLYIPCNFSGEELNSTTLISAGWLQEYSYLPFNQINLIGDLIQKNCTSVFPSLRKDHTNSYVFRLLTAVALCDHVEIHVKDSAPSPWIHPSHLQLKEEESVTITCSALTPCPHSPPKLTWNLQQDAENNMEENTDRTFTTKIQQVITVSDQHDGYNISCSAAYPVDEGTGIKTAETNVTLSVSYAPKNTSVSISPSGLVGEGVWVNLTCSSRANPPVRNFTWFKTSTHGPIRVSGGDVYSFSLTNDTEGDYYCEATNDVGKQTSPVIHVNMKGKAKNPEWVPILGGVVGILIIICLAVCLWCLILKRRTQNDTENQMLEELPDVSANKTEEEIQYGQIYFSKGRSGRSSPSGLDSGHQQETMYAQIQVSGAPQRHTGDGSEDLYAQVKNRNTEDLYAQVKNRNTEDLYAQVKNRNTEDLYAHVKKT